MSVGDSRKSSKRKSYRLVGKYEQPWLDDKRMSRSRYNTFIVYGFMILGLAISAYICWAKARTVVKHDYCLILDENFESIDPAIWNHEVFINGGGTGSFEWVSNDPANSFVTVDGLHILPTLTNETTDITSAEIYNGYTLNLTTAGTCTSKDQTACSIRSNISLGATIPPIRSARMTTAGKKSIRYGKVEVVAKLPRGDWLWPAIWMFPEDSVYGAWPASGEIDLAESRGNPPGYKAGGRDVFTSTLHWGPDTANDGFWRTTVGKQLRRGDFSTAYHTFSLEWSENYIFTYLDFQLQQVLYFSFRKQKDLWDRGGFATATSTNNTLIKNPWQNSLENNAPFDQSFYLILNVAVGSRNGWFPDGDGGKPWADGAASAAGNFFAAAETWLPTWGEGNDRALNVKSVKMWQQGKCGDGPS